MKAIDFQRHVLERDLETVRRAPRLPRRIPAHWWFGLGLILGNIQLGLTLLVLERWLQ